MIAPDASVYILLPCHSLEDFPTYPHGQEAESLLAAWTVGWHPALLAATGRVPSWHRAEVPPTDLDNRVLLVPQISYDSLPPSFAENVENAQNCQRIDVSTRREALTRLGIDTTHQEAARDFFALSFTLLQVQLMTRQLRYSTNLDEGYLEQQAVEAARQTIGGNHEAATEALHRCFDCLAEERDHYFSGDPHLIDLTLLAPTCLGPALSQMLAAPGPQNLLLSAELARQLGQKNAEAAGRIAERVAAGDLSLAGGMPDDQASPNLWTSQRLAREVESCREEYRRSLGAAPRVYGRFGGGHARQLPPLLKANDYLGAIIADFSRGEGSADDEPKLLWESGGATIDCIAGVPLDASDPHWMLGVGVRLGEAIDAGYVPTALFAHWPGATCDAFEDLKVAARWGKALGTFRTLEDYFENSERPFHSLHSAPPTGGGDWLRHLVEKGAAQAKESGGALHRFASEFRQSIRVESETTVHAMADMICGARGDEAASPLERVAQTLGETASPTAASLVLNPHAHATRGEIESETAVAAADCVYFTDTVASKRIEALVDVPAVGFVRVVPGGTPRRKLLGRRARSIVEGHLLRNEFFEASINADSGALSSVYLVGARSNRLSTQLAMRRGTAYSRMECTSVEVIRSDSVRGVIRTTGRLVDNGGEVLAGFELDYSLHRGSRIVEIAGNVTPRVELDASEPWRNYIALRTAWGSQAGTVRVMVHDALRYPSGRQWAAPLGFLVDEVDHTFALLGGGFPAHVKREGRMADTLVAAGDCRHAAFKLGLGFDLPAPVHAARQFCVPPEIVTLPQGGGAPVTQSGWLIYPDSPRLVITRIESLPPAAGGTLRLRIDLCESDGRSLVCRLHTYSPITDAVWSGHEGARREKPEVLDHAVAIRLAGYEAASLVIELGP